MIREDPARPWAPAQVSPGVRPPVEHSGLVIETARDAWIYCKASKKMVAGNQMLPWLSASSAVISAVTGVAVFSSLQDDPAPWARIVVGAVAIVTGVVAALQTWAASRIRTLNNQARSFHDFHRDVMADVEAGSDLREAGYAARRESELQGIVAGISEPSERVWRDAEARVDQEWDLLFPHVLLSGAASTARSRRRPTR